MPITCTTFLAEDAPVVYTLVETAWGEVGMVCRGEVVVGVILPGDGQGSAAGVIAKEYPQSVGRDGWRGDLQEAIRGYFAGGRAAFDCTVDISGLSGFGQAVLRQCCWIPAGETVSYGQLARQAGYPGAARAVGTVMAGNRIPLLIPCHRVVRADGAPGGYSAQGGTALKKRLLRLERQGR